MIYLAAVAVQIAVPVKTIVDKEIVLANAIEYKFKMVPVDPEDPFRGRYVSLRFEEQTFESSKDQGWQYGEDIYISLEIDTNGFAKISKVFKKAPESDNFFLKAKVKIPPTEEENTGTLELPFERLYMQELDAPLVEEAFQSSFEDSMQVQYATVLIYKGDGILGTLYINNTPIKDLLENK